MRDQESREYAKEFERKYQVQDIAGKYVFPEEEGFDRVSLQQKIWEQYDSYNDYNVIAKHTAAMAKEFGYDSLSPFEITTNPSLNKLYRQYVEYTNYNELVDIFNRLEALNNETMSRIEFDSTDPKQLSDVVHGMVSGFNPNDISYYINKFNPESKYSSATDKIKSKKLAKEIMSKLEGDPNKVMGWIPSLATLEKIWEQVENRVVIFTSEKQTPNRIKFDENGRIRDDGLKIVRSIL